MKRILSIAVMAAGIGAFVSCNNTANVEKEDTTAIVVTDPVTPVATTPTYTEGDVIKKDGKAHVYQNGNWVVLEKDVTLDNGVVVKKTGEVRNKEGKVVVLEEGAYVTKTGNFFDRTGAAIENAWDATKRGVENAADATKEGLRKAGDSISAGAQRVGDKINEAVK
ncbi:DUF6799 domain-containing protein [Haoranjiania flava]|uniref:DUF6799 domain-containing protein n=1 Tax=Haoranjiania flava TaxID=1856322 RepID=A0AAE3LK35_9BACT|nr:DUF6799 domain-containing protein [Haoranjiania flava]MCU7693989.1 hypothetical protein [Haoranjiania flava]